MYIKLDTEDIQKKTTTQHPTTIDMDDQTTIPSMTPNNYNYKIKTDRIDAYIESFSWDRKLLIPNLQQKLKSQTSNSKDESEEESEEKMPDLQEG